MRSIKSNLLMAFLLLGGLFTLGAPEAGAAGTLTAMSGSNNQVQINAALKSGGVVHLSAGEYVISDTIVMNSGNTLEGASGARIVLVGNANWPKNKNMIEGLSVSNVRITGFEVDGNRAANETSNGADTSCGLYYYTMIYFKGSSGIEVDNMYLHHNWNDILKFSACSNVKFHNNTVRQPGHDVVYAIKSSNVWVYNNYIRIYCNSGVRPDGTKNIYIYNNDIARDEGAGGYAGIEIQGASTVFICSNNIHDTAGGSVVDLSGGSATITYSGCPASGTGGTGASSGTGSSTDTGTTTSAGNNTGAGTSSGTSGSTCTATDSKGNTTVTTTDCSGNVSCTTTDKSGNVVSTATGTTTTDSSGNKVTTTTDSKGNTTTTVDSCGKATATTTNASGAVVSTATGSTTTDSSGNTVTTTTDSSGNKTVTTTNSSGKATSTTTNSSGAVVSTGTGTTTTDANGNKTTVITDTKGYTTTTTTSGTGNVTSTTTDSSGNVVSTATGTTTTDANGNTTTTTTDSSGNTTTSTTTANGNVSTTTTDANGNVVSTSSGTTSRDSNYGETVLGDAGWTGSIDNRDPNNDVPEYYDPSGAVTAANAFTSMATATAPAAKALEALFGALGDSATTAKGTCNSIEGSGGFIPCGQNADDPNTAWNECDQCSLCSMVLMGQLSITFLIKVAATAAALAIVFAGYVYIFAVGKAEMISKAKLMMKYALIGCVIIFLAWAIVDSLLSTLGYIDPMGDNWYTIC